LVAAGIPTCCDFHYCIVGYKSVSAHTQVPYDCDQSLMCKYIFVLERELSQIKLGVMSVGIVVFPAF